MPSHRYRAAHDRVDLSLPDRKWPNERIERAPLWVPVDLRDGNQALAEPMGVPRKQRMFDLLVALGFKEIEVAYPSASQTDFDFVRNLATSDTVPEDVTVSVFTPARKNLIERTFEAVEGLPRAVVHLCAPTAPMWRDLVLGSSRDDVHGLVRESATLMLRLADSRPGQNIRFQFSPEVFVLTEPDYVMEICDGLTELWDADSSRPVIYNLPATVEISTPNFFADQIEYAHRALARRDSVILSVHPHNDRGTGVACAELALMAGAQRVEGCLFGNGERTGNVDLVTLVLNLHSQGVDPMVDLSDIDAVRATVEHCNRLPVHPRHPYGGDLVYTAFSGTHQDAISKGMAHHVRRAADTGVPLSQTPWEVPYLPIDPTDVGRSYEAVIRVDSQSGKSGVAYLLQDRYGLDLPQDLRVEFSRVVQDVADNSGEEVTPKELWEIFRVNHLEPGQDSSLTLASWNTEQIASSEHRFTCHLEGVNVLPGQYEGTGGSSLTAFTAALDGAGLRVHVFDYSEHAAMTEPGGLYTAYVRCRTGDTVQLGRGPRHVSAVRGRQRRGGRRQQGPVMSGGTSGTPVPRTLAKTESFPFAGPLSPYGSTRKDVGPRSAPGWQDAIELSQHSNTTLQSKALFVFE